MIKKILPAFIVVVMMYAWPETGMCSERRNRSNTLRPSVSKKKLPDAGISSGLRTIDFNSGSCGDTLLSISGYDKTAASTRESVFITNRMARDTIRSVTLEMTYTDTGGQPLHARSVKISCKAAPGMTVRADFPSWDSQHLFYYHLSPAPVRKAASPYEVSIKPVAVEVSLPASGQ